MKDLKKHLEYLHKLGAGSIYASPIFESVPGSMHGYDGINPEKINPEIGSGDELFILSGKLNEKGMGWIQDIVPNHLAFDPRNPWIFDVLEKGRFSVYSGFFDINWSDKDPLMAPFLGDELTEVIRQGNLKLIFRGGRFYLQVYDKNYPVNPGSYDLILNYSDQKVPSFIEKLLKSLPSYSLLKKDPGRFEEFIKLLDAETKQKQAVKFIETSLLEINNSPDSLAGICNMQFYRLCYWQETNERINYRRFFTINGLICLNIHKPAVFKVYHQEILKLLGKDVINGLRIDHIDGLYDPSGYLERLRKKTGTDPWIAVEKILEEDEKIPGEWPVQGETGYSFLAMVNNLFTNAVNKKKFTDYYSKICVDDRSLEDQLKAAKTKILFENMAGELKNLTGIFLEAVNLPESGTEEIHPKNIQQVIANFLVECPVYRYYGNHMPLPEKEKKNISGLLEKVKNKNLGLRREIILLEKSLFNFPGENKKDYNRKILHFYLKLMQLSGPLMAKGMEDTLMYRYHRFIGHNEVGDSPGRFGMDVGKWHRKMNERQRLYPLAMNTTSTHDTKRGEDVRARLNVLTDMPETWFEKVEEFREINRNGTTGDIPDKNDEYFLYTTLLGMYPMPGEDNNSEEIANRLREYFPKALREAKMHSDWTNPDKKYENATCDLATSLLDKKGKFWRSFTAFHRKIADFGIINSLSQLTLKCMSPGLPDIYRGTELWDLSLVDPDNRRAVDFVKRNQWLNEIKKLSSEDPISLSDKLWKGRYNGKIKLWLTEMLLNLRKSEPELFAEGEYIPLETCGKYKNNVMAFLRKRGKKWILVAVPLHLAEILNGDENEIRKFNWEDTSVLLPKHSPGYWFNLVSGKEAEKIVNRILVNEVFSALPLTILQTEYTESTRSAGILLHITSLPSQYGTGDFGPAAYDFVDFLSRAGQRYWQVLPLNPVNKKAKYSPYDSASSMAGNILLISPDMLVKLGLLEERDLSGTGIINDGKADFQQVERIKRELVSITYTRYQTTGYKEFEGNFKKFCKKEEIWLEDYALFEVLKENFDGTEWYTWPDLFKKRNKSVLNEFVKEHKAELEKVKWSQFIFSVQWKSLKDYCNSRGIELFGDIPFYVSYDSADVWANPALFSLDEQGNRTAVAGVPPDYFNDEGQLWGMPVYRWDVIRKFGFSWWKERIRRNLEMYDLVRLDHFRAFSAYWEVPADNTTAKNGKWKKGPGADFFRELKKEFDSIPLVAEDLGDINEPVHNLRRKFNMPGMKVLQFGFGRDIAIAENISHNFEKDTFVYTGTHDNNTTLGWYRQNTTPATRKRLKAYLGKEINEKNIQRELIRLAYSSVSASAIIPMQDLLGLDESACMNVPGTSDGNWTWRMKEEELSEDIERYLGEMVKVFGREGGCGG